jgi:hypothetical protein
LREVALEFPVKLAFLLIGIVAAASVSVPSDASAETREQYLSRLKDICAVECLKPKDFRRQARKNAKKNEKDMAILMDVRTVRRVGDRYELLSMNLERSNLETLAILGGAGIDTSGRTGVGGLPRNARGNTDPQLIIIELDKEVLGDFLSQPARTMRVSRSGSSEGKIVVEGDRSAQRFRPSLAALDAFFMNRRIVVRGRPELQATWIGGRRDFRRKQVTLKVDNADDLAVLPRYTDKGELIVDDLPWVEPTADPAP